MRKPDCGNWLSTLLASVLLVAVLTLAGCGSSGGGTPRATAPAELANKAFLFPAAQALFDPGDPLFGQDVTLTVGDFAGSTAAATLVGANDGTILGGTLTLGSCTLTLNYQQVAGGELEVAPEGEEDVAVLDPCRVLGDGSLEITDTETGEVFTSQPATAPPVLLDLTVDLSAQYEVPGDLINLAQLEGRPETGTAALQLLTGNLLSYSLEVFDLTAGDALQLAHIHTGGVTENGPPVITLANVPLQDARPVNPLFAAGATGITASIALTNEEVASLTNPDNDFYVNIHSTQVGGGVVRGQLGEDIVLASNVELSTANEVPPVVGRTETGFAVLRVLSDNTLAYALEVDGLADGDELQIAHIHTGDSTVNGPPVITLVGVPTQPTRPTNPEFGAGETEISAELLLTADEMTDLLNSANPFYVNIHSAQQSGGLVRGQIRDIIDGNIQPTANAGPDQTVTEGDAVTLNGTASTDTDGTLTSFSWTQTGGTPTVMLTGATTDTATFTAPEVDEGGATLTFTLTVEDDGGLTDPDIVNVIVNDAGAGIPTVSFSSDIQPIYTQNCALPTCHAGIFSPNLLTGQAYGNIVGVPSAQNPTLDLVEPSDADNSYLFRKHTGQGILGSRMPQNNPSFFDNNPDLLELERLWIEQGASDN